MILLVDNYDSFSYNLCQLFQSLGEDVVVRRNDEISAKEAGEIGAEAIVLSPGPGRPENAGVTFDVIRMHYKTIPIFGVCLGEQAIASEFLSLIRWQKVL